MSLFVGPNTSVSSSAITPPSVANSSSLPSVGSTANGAMSYSLADDKLYYKSSGGSWQPITPRLGTVSRPAPSAAAIISAGDSVGDGIYYISSSSGTVQTYCDMTNGGYMLVAKLNSTQNDEWMYGGSYWSTSSPVNESSCTTVSDDNDSVSRLYYEYTLTTGFRLCLGSVSNALTEAKTGGTAKSFFTGSSSSSGNSRANFMSWFQTGTGQSSTNFDNQGNCNHVGFNISGPSYAMRWGISMNNEEDCNSNDSGIGMGTYTNGQTTVGSGSRNVNAGGHRWNPDARYGALGLIFVK